MTKSISSIHYSFKGRRVWGDMGRGKFCLVVQETALASGHVHQFAARLLCGHEDGDAPVDPVPFAQLLPHLGFESGFSKGSLNIISECEMGNVSRYPALLDFQSRLQSLQRLSGRVRLQSLISDGRLRAVLFGFELS